LICKSSLYIPDTIPLPNIYSDSFFLRN
jgi:hypothetical protein